MGFHFMKIINLIPDVFFLENNGSNLEKLILREERKRIKENNLTPFVIVWQGLEGFHKEVYCYNKGWKYYIKQIGLSSLL